MKGPDAAAAREHPSLPLLAFAAERARDVTIEPAPRWRDWINEMDQRWGNRCLPLLVANEAGWVLLNPVRFEAVWDGGPGTSATTIDFEPEVPDPGPVTTHFGYGILTWRVPYLFRTPPGYNLLARGPANWPKDGLCALEGLVETDWSVATFTMNWKLTRPGHPVVFEEDEPFCMVVPQRRGELEAFSPEIRDLDDDPELYRATDDWSRRREQSVIRKFLGRYSADFEEFRTAWEQDYFRGRTPDGTAAPEHQTKLNLREFDPG